MAMVGHAMDRGGLKDSENASENAEFQFFAENASENSFFPEINRTVFEI